MSAARGFFDLPYELRMLIIQQMSPDGFLFFAFSVYDAMLQYHQELVPAVMPDTATTSQSIPAFEPLPTEVILSILADMALPDRIPFALSVYPLLRSRGLVPAFPAPVLTSQLSSACSLPLDQARTHAPGSP